MQLTVIAFGQLHGERAPVTTVIISLLDQLMTRSSVGHGTLLLVWLVVIPVSRCLLIVLLFTDYEWVRLISCCKVHPWTGIIVLVTLTPFLVHVSVSVYRISLFCAVSRLFHMIQWPASHTWSTILC